MSLTRKIAHNTLVQVLGRGGAGVLAVVAISLITRYLGTEGFGFYTTAISFLQFFGILIDFGLTMMTVQMISEREDGAEKIVGNVLALRTVSAVIFLGIAPAVALFFPYPAIVKWGILITSLTFVSQLVLQTISGIFQKHLAMHIPAAADFISRLFYVAAVALLIYFKQGILSILLALAVSNCFSLAIVYFYAGKFVPIKPMWDFAVWKEILRRSWPIGLSIILNLIYLKADILILSVFKSQSEVGLYGAPYKLIDALTMFAMLFMGLILPLLAAAWTKGDKARFAALFQKTFNLLVIFTVPMVLGAHYLSEKVMVFVAGANFAASGKILAILTLGVGAIFIGSLFSHAIVAIDKQKLVIWGYLADAVLSLIGYFIFIPKYSYIGAAWVTVFSEAFIVLIGVVIVWRETKIRPKILKILFKSALAATPMVLALRYLQNAQALLAIGAAAAVYVIFIVLFRGITASEVRQIIKLK
jgi:O-antigen/teichoic acid export membrane protein